MERDVHACMIPPTHTHTVTHTSCTHPDACTDAFTVSHTYAACLLLQAHMLMHTHVCVPLQFMKDEDRQKPPYSGNRPAVDLKEHSLKEDMTMDYWMGVSERVQLAVSE